MYRRNLEMLLFLILCVISSGRAKVVSFKQGALNGTTMVARNGKIFNAFLGIPFAKPPVGELRFEAPEPFGSWEGIRDGAILPKCCLQWNKEVNDGSLLGSEDCLYINVFTPLNITHKDSLPVLFYIYGGIYKTGSNVANGPQYFMSNDVVLVIPNYRGGAFGFLSTGDTVIPGNFGLKDQLLAMKWTRENVQYFGGDPDRITMQGHSSGAMMAHMHTLVPQSKGYFQQVILQSGTSFCEMSYFDANVSRSVAKEFAERVNCSTESSEAMKKCFMELDAAVFPTVTEQMYVWNKDPNAPFRPTVEDKRVKNAFLTQVPNKLKYHSPELPLLIGLTSGEGAMKAHEYIYGDGHLIKELNHQYKDLFPITLQYAWHAKPNTLDFISVLLKTHYFGNKNIGYETLFNVTDLYTHGLFGYCTVDAIRRYEGPKHVYVYDYASNYSVTRSLQSYPVYLGVGHSDELPLFYYKWLMASSFSPEDTMVSEEIVKRWVNFVYSSDPNKPFAINKTLMSPWEPVKSKRLEYLRIGINSSMETDLYKGIYDFWERLPILSKYFKYS